MKKILLLLGGLGLLTVQTSFGQIDPYHRNLLQLGVDVPLVGHGPQGIYAYYYYNNPEIFRPNTNIALRAAIAPAYLDSELGFKELISPTTDLGIGIYGGAFSDNYYEVRQGQFLHGESFDGYGGGAAVSIYQRINPSQEVPLNLVARGGLRYTTYDAADKTAGAFVLPEGRVTTFTRVGLRLAGKEPILYPELGLEVSAWFERQWRGHADSYGFGGDRKVEATTDLYWLYAGLNYTWTNIGHQVSFATTAGGSTDADRFSAWRLGGVLPLVSEFPLVLPGYFYQEITAQRMVHLYGSYLIPIDSAKRFHFRTEAAAACLDYLPGFAQRDSWQTGAGCSLEFTPLSKACRVVLRYGYGFNAIRGGDEGSHSVGLLVQYDFEKHLKKRREAKAK